MNKIRENIDRKATEAKPTAKHRFSCHPRIAKIRNSGEYELRNKSTLVDILGIGFSWTTCHVMIPG